ncbi:dynein regulatory complex protein 11 [Monodelphis domestica]|uniref:dynein regulatory complex protein 11 n=1 Tax=Monodelphis domestica TaxID=13616 RepID=UPI0024E1E8FE|nr:dynein regulatory complex protein 11 [Monodelphis domestica]
MSNATYNKMWEEAQDALNSVLEGESEKALEPPQDQVVIFQMLATFYVKYVQIFRNLENAYDQMVHPQKRILVRQVLDAVMGRILELKNEMVELEFSEFHYFDDILQDLKLAPEQLDIPIPKYFLKEKMEMLKEREKILTTILSHAGLETLMVKFPMKVMPLEEAVKLIQIAERARQGRLRAVFMKQIYQQDFREKQARLHGEKIQDMGVAAIRIQKLWRAFYQFRKTLKEKEEEMIFLGMNPSPQIQSFNSTLLNAQKVNFQRYQVQEKHEVEYKEALINIKSSLKRLEGADIKESLQDQIRHWFIECRNMTGYFPEYPTEEDGGSAIIFSEKTPEQIIEDIIAREVEEEEKKKKKEAEERKGKKKKEKVEKKETKKTEEDEKWKMSPSLFIPDMEEGNNKYKGEYKKGKRGKKGKKEKDLTPHRSVDSLYKELVEEGLLIRPLKVHLSEYIGEFCYLGTTLRHIAIEPMPSLSDVRQLITLYGILPLGSQSVHEKAPLVKTLLLTGPSGVGKKMLVHAICTETGANLFDLSPSKITGKYPGKTGLQMMLHLVMKVARLLQPSVVWIGDTEKTFYKKVPKNEKEMDPKRLKKHLPKIIKMMKAEDRVLIVGTSKRPFEADIKPLCKVYQKIIMIPRPDYASRFVLWKQVIQQAGGKITNSLNISCLSKITDGFTQGQIIQVIKNVLTDRRVRQQRQKVLTAMEFIAGLARLEPVYKEEEESFKTWYSKTPLGKKRANALSGIDDKDKGKGKNAKGKEKEKKGKRAK